ncbi:MAG: ATP-binding protein [Candidatus Omnitrophota bacterium]
METLDFFTRKLSLDSLNKRIADFKDGYRQNIAILGDELTGKTTLLKTILNTTNDEELIPIYVEIMPYEFSMFVKRFLTSLLYNYLKRYRLISARENLDFLIKMAQENLPTTAPQIKNLHLKLSKEKPEILFRELFNIIETFHEETKKRCVVIFDEFHNLKKFEIKNICQELGKKIMFQKDTFFIFASSSKSEAKTILNNDLSLLFGNFETTELGMLDAKSCNFLIREIFQDIVISKDFIDFLINFTDGHPFYLKLFSQEAVSLCKIAGLPELEKEALIQAFENLLFCEWGIFNIKFMHFLSQLTSNRTKNHFIYLLDALALGKNRIQDLASQLRRQKSELTQKLNRLIEQDIVIKNGSFYSIKDRVFWFWLKFVHHEKLNSLTPDHSEQVQHFKFKIDAEMDEFMNASKKNIIDRMIDLFNLFEGDDIQIDKKRFQLSIFKELKIVRFDNTNIKLGIFGKSQDCFWLAAIKEDGIKEGDISEFIQSSKKFKQKSINKVMIGLSDIDRNAKLLAKESRIITLDLAHVNSLFDIYGKPRIIR